MNASRWISHLPKTVRGNLCWRAEAQLAARRDVKLQRQFRDACFEDLLFFVNGFCWLHEPRAEGKIIPFTTWSHQDPAFLAADQAIADSEWQQEPIDVTWDKTRAQGASYMFVDICVRRWLRDRMFSAGLVTRNMDCCDSPTDPSTLMWKVDWTIKRLPFWLRPKSWERLLSKHTITNFDKGSTFIGFTATGDVGAGGRLTVLGFDEVARFDPSLARDAMDATQHITYCRQFISAHYGDTGVFYEMIFEDNSARRIVLDWKDNPTQNPLMYRWVGGRPWAVKEGEQAAVEKYVAVDRPAIDKLIRRGFIREGIVSSPWRDKQCRRPGATPRGIAQELDRDPRGTVGKLFNSRVLDDMKKKHAKPAVWEGRPIVHEGQLRLIRQEGGPLRLWFELGLDDEAPRGKYSVGCDIGTGAGEVSQSNSAMIAGNCRTGQQVLEYIDPGISESRFARLAVAVCKWLHNATLIWEAMGPTGKRFGTTVMQDLGYSNVWMRPKDDAWSRGDNTRKPGWVNNRTSDKADLFEDLWVAMDDELFFPRSDEFLKECGGWEWDDKHPDKIIYRGTGHGDRAIAGGLCWKAMKDFQKIGVDSGAKEGQTAPIGSIAWHEEQDRIRERNSRRDDEVDFGVSRGRVDRAQRILAGGRF